MSKEQVSGEATSLTEDVKTAAAVASNARLDAFPSHPVSAHLKWKAF